jgi:hypothetical protein
MYPRGEQQMTDRQLAYMLRLAAERQITPEQGTRLAGVVDRHRSGAEPISKDRASQIIDWLIAQPAQEGVEVRSETGVDVSGLQPGRYAVGDVLFSVQRPEAGRWAGWTFVRNGSEYVDERFGSQKPGGTYWGANADLVARIVADPIEAMTHYGRITGRCAVCNRTLEDEVSVARGIGPVCWEKVS